MLIGFLLAGFLLNMMKREGGEFLSATADLGITLLLFRLASLQLKSVARPGLGVATIHMGVVTVLILLWCWRLPRPTPPCSRARHE